MAEPAPEPPEIEIFWTALHAITSGYRTGRMTSAQAMAALCDLEDRHASPTA